MWSLNFACTKQQKLLVGQPSIGLGRSTCTNIRVMPKWTTDALNQGGIMTIILTYIG